jgi:hypothetical protein
VSRRWIAAALTVMTVLGGSAAAAVPAAASPAAAVTPAACHWFGASVTPRPGFDVILWEYSCTGGRHCQVVSHGWRGKMTVQLISSGVVIDTAQGYLVHSGDSINTRTFYGADQCGWDGQPFPS